MCIMEWHGLLLSIMNWWLGVQQKGETHTNVVYEYLLYLGDKYYNWQRTSFLGFLDHVFLEQVLSISLARFLDSGFFDQVHLIPLVPYISSDSKWDASPVSQVDISTYSEVGATRAAVDTSYLLPKSSMRVNFKEKILELLLAIFGKYVNNFLLGYFMT
ncbi:hypothetical protein IFM89_034444 [Coptis chinensis]|uniref:Maturase K n=1 Tax=Coptis chinensis TaxID=261450 RepID=A0A835IWL7_9MAGN|nr:hypothetical protein IFM89_034444 [Coptis chinensis]